MLVIVLLLQAAGVNAAPDTPERIAWRKTPIDVELAVGAERLVHFPGAVKVGVPPQLLSCHTGTINGYWVEGHVPADLVQKLITEKPTDIRGISAPGMPKGSPGMEGPNPAQYDIIAYHANGTTSVYATRQGKEAVE